MKPRSILAALVTLTVLAVPAPAHQGPPFPVVVDQHAGPYVLSVYADPDIGIGTFFVSFDPVAHGDDPRVAIEVAPASGRLPPRAAQIEHQRDGTYVGRVEFDQGEMWDVVLRVDGARGPAEHRFQVEATPPGYGAWDLLVYGGPFLLLGGMWALVVIRRRKLEREAALASS